jgi:hypothetical protein
MNLVFRLGSDPHIISLPHSKIWKKKSAVQNTGGLRHIRKAIYKVQISMQCMGRHTCICGVKFHGREVVGGNIGSKRLLTGAMCVWGGV